MIRSLRIRNYAIIESVDIDFSDNLTIITGETGAGKSILMGALGLIMGNRAETKVLYDLNNKCTVEAVFDIANYNLKDLFDKLDLDYSDETIIRREILPNGKTRAFVNDSPVVLDALRELTEHLVDIHQQFDTLIIQNPNFQLKVIDALADNKNILSEYDSKYLSYVSDSKEIEKLKASLLSANKENDYLIFQLRELEEADLVEGEQEELELEQKKLSNAELIKRALMKVSMGLTEDEMSVVSLISDCLNESYSVSKYHPRIAELTEKLENIKYELEELSSDFQDIADSTDYDAERITEIENRLSVLFKLEKKHFVSTDRELIQIQQELQKNLKGHENLEQRIINLEKKLLIQEKELFEIGKILTDRRLSAAAVFEDNIHNLLVQLSMSNARIKVEIQEISKITASGTDQLKFLFASNKGSRLEEIKGIVSGGEMSRLALCIKSLIANAMTLPTLIFDEIDAGVSGEVALQMGNIMKYLASKHQVISITHSPQIAAKANAHYFVQKVDAEERTLTTVSLLEENDRIIEIAKMLSGNPPSEFAKANAIELLSR